MSQQLVRLVLNHVYLQCASNLYLLRVRYTLPGLSGDGEGSIIGSARWTCRDLHQRISLEAGLHFCEYVLAFGDVVLQDDDTKPVPSIVFEQPATIVILNNLDCDSD